MLIINAINNVNWMVDKWIVCENAIYLHTFKNSLNNVLKSLGHMQSMGSTVSTTILSKWMITHIPSSNHEIILHLYLFHSSLRGCCLCWHRTCSHTCHRWGASNSVRCHKRISVWRWMWHHQRCRWLRCTVTWLRRSTTFRWLVKVSNAVTWRCLIWQHSSWRSTCCSNRKICDYLRRWLRRVEVNGTKRSPWCHS